MQAEAGKGSKPRNTNDQEAYASGWDLIFGKKKHSVDCLSGEVADCKSVETGSTPVSTSINKEPNEKAIERIYYL